MAEMSRVSEIVLGAPIAAVNEKHGWMRTFSRWQAHVHELVGIGAIRQPLIGFRRLLAEDVFALHEEKYRTPVSLRSFASSKRTPLGATENRLAALNCS